MTPLGWIFMILSWAFTTILTGYCFWKIFKKKHPTKHDKDVYSA